MRKLTICLSREPAGLLSPSVKTRHKFFDMMSAEKVTVVGFHYQFPPIGHVEKNGTGYRLVRTAWNPTL